jgi:hypothetical protein
VSVNPVSPTAFNGGQMTDLPVFSGSFDGTELFEIVAPGNVAQGVNYSITSLLFATLVGQITLVPVIISNGQYTSPASPYVVPITTSRIYINKSNNEPTYIRLAAAASYLVEPLIREIAGNANNTITVNMTGGQLADGNAVVPIQSAYSGYFFRPVAALGSWTLGVG